MSLPEQSADTAIIRVENLEHSYGDFKAVDDISFSVKKGEIFSFLGPNGAGKSTAINVLITLLALQKGKASIDGHDVTKDPQKVRESIGIVFQDVTLDRDMTVWEILEFHGRLYNMPREERKKRIEELLELVQLTAKRDERTKNLSGGMKRRLEIARGLMTRPKVLFLDEPTIGLDPQTRMRMWEYIKGVNHEGTTIFLTTHYMDEADHLSDRISIIDQGKIIISGTSWELKNTLGQDIIYLETNDNENAIRLLRNLPSVRASRGAITCRTDLRQSTGGT
jgi:ABC-2 type transport system ATP-binding protein